jgi:CRISPR-associated protein Csb2
MPDFLRISVRFLDGEFHGRGDGGGNEWPPSPLRLFQALVAASAARWNERRGILHAAPALRWLETLPPPTIIAPKSAEGAAYRLYVPDNVSDLVGQRWSKGNEGSMADFRTEKTVRPTHIEGEGAVHFLWPLCEDGDRPHVATLLTAARSITHLGWGVDLAVVEASVIDSTAVTELEGETWQPTTNLGGTSLRTPQSGTFEDLERRHRAFLQRVNGIDSSTFSPVPPLGAFSSVDYRSDSDPVRPSVAIFALRLLDDSGFRSVDSVRRGLHVAAMLRHIVGGAELARSVGWSDAETARLVHGHADAEVAIDPKARLLFLPLPSIEPRGEGKAAVVGRIRRIAIAASGDLNREQFSRLAQGLAGLELIDEKTGAPSAVLARLPANDPLSQKHYLRASATWTTVTPVILPGYDDPRKIRQRLRENSALTAEEKRTLLDKLDQRIDFLLRKAIRQGGFPEALARHAAIEWRGSGYLPGTDLASRYMAGDQHRRYRKLHVRIQFRDAGGKPLPIPGPLCLGGGRFCGIGLFVALT